MDDDIKDLSKYIGNWQYVNGEVRKNFYIKIQRANLDIDTHIKALNRRSESSSAGSSIYLDESADKFKTVGIGFEINFAKYCSLMYYSFYNYYDYLVVAYTYQECLPCGGMSGIYKKIEK